MVIVSLLSGARNGNHVVETHHEVGHNNRLNSPQELGRALNLFAFVFVFRHQKLDTDPHEKRRTHHL